MEGTSVLLNESAVKSEIATINSLAAEVQKAANDLIQEAAKCIEVGIQTDWGKEFIDDLRRFQSQQLEEAIAEIKLQASKLETASQAFTAYSKGQNTQM